MAEESKTRKGARRTRTTKFWVTVGRTADDWDQESGWCYGPALRCRDEADRSPTDEGRAEWLQCAAGWFAREAIVSAMFTSMYIGRGAK